MATKQPHNPKRFDVYNELPDGSGFTVPGSKFVFKFDRFGGWFDEFGNYYDSNAKPETPPSDSDHSQHVSEHSDRSYSDNDQDEFEKQFGKPKYIQEDDDEFENIFAGKILTNLQTLKSYPVGHPFRVRFSNLSYFSNRQQVFNYFKAKVPGIINVIFLQNEKNQFNGNGYFVVQDIFAGESLIKLEGEKIENREVKFFLDDVEDVIQDTLEPEELFPAFSEKKNNKNFITKGKPSSVKSPQVQQKPSPVKKQEKVEVKPEVFKPAKVVNLQEFLPFKFQKKAFPKKSSFKQWIEENKFSHVNDIQQVTKIDGDENYAKVVMKSKIYQNLNGKYYNGMKIVFQPIL